MKINSRIKTAIVLIPIMLVGIYLLPLAGFAIFMGLIAVLGAWEWADMAGCGRRMQRLLYSLFIGVCVLGLYVVMSQQLVADGWALSIAVAWWLLGFALILLYPRATGVWGTPFRRLVAGTLVLCSMWVGFYWIKGADESNVLITLLMLLVWGADIGAYYAGRAFGKRKLLPNVSPGKTWAGAIAAIGSAMLIGIVVVALVVDTQLWRWEDYLLLLLFAGSVVVMSIVGDLVESMVKRQRGLKDSGALLPGHGGIMDRIDSMCAAAPVFAAFLYVWPAL
ncbi:phosphatidate cytidylyltransferase [Salinispirillum sp. LH 10-3-1]|uniref:Phosphatidate cytidylyltransferase n=1 Tax=Salinispirillum sp. LH 10-3-1 TaxID=2952525 RepID=A0AB38YIH5_9GAMM